MFVHISTIFLLFAQLTNVFALPATDDAANCKDASSKPTQKFSATQRLVGRRVRNGPRAYRKALLKFNLPVHEDLAKVNMTGLSEQIVSGKVKGVRRSKHAQIKRQSVAASSPTIYDNQYICPVTIGTQTVNLAFDTGSSDLWVFSEKLTAAQAKGHLIYNSTLSQNYTQLSGYSWKITYGDGSGASGIVGTDRVTVGGMTVSKQPVELATAVSSQFTQDTANSGLLGLGFGNINTVKPAQQKTWFENVTPQLRLPLFTANLKHGAPGSYDFGFINNTRYTGNLTYSPVSSARGWWQVSTAAYQVGNANYTSPSGTFAIADTGTSLIIAPQTMVSNYYSKVNGVAYSNSYGYMVPCSANVPSFSITMGNSMVTIPSPAMIWAPFSQGYCYGALQKSSSNAMVIMGDVFFKQYFTVFDYNGPRLGIAPKSQFA